MQSLTGVMLAFLLVGALMLAIERLWPSRRGQPILRRGFWLDGAYWLFTPIVTRAVTRAGVALALVVLATVLGWKIDKSTILAGHGPLAAQPRWLQAIEQIVLLDLAGYWTHRLFHSAALWPIHAIHHSSEDLDWLSSVRIHPLNDLGNRIVPAVLLVLAGFKPDVLAVTLPVFALYAILLHANVDWDFGPFRAIVASPRFHRWHHTSEAEGRDKNFAGLLPVWDILFGTYYMPAGAPRQFGVPQPVPTTLWGQLVWPFRRAARR